ncbi:MAG TPA: hypothetical protein VJP77_05465 [Planctomycetota bacterium]|nr:hypothetical protein [Planctomycetota bacterium]
MLFGAATAARVPSWPVALLLAAAACGGGGSVDEGASAVRQAAVDGASPRQVLWTQRGEDDDPAELYLTASVIDVRAEALPSGPPRFKQQRDEQSVPVGRFGWRRTPEGRIQVEAANAEWYSRTTVGLLLHQEAARWSVEVAALHHWSDAGGEGEYRRVDVGSVFLDPDPEGRKLRVAAAFGSDGPYRPHAGSFSAEIDLSLDQAGDEIRLPLAEVWRRLAEAEAERAGLADRPRADRAAALATPDVLRAVERGHAVVAVTPIGRGMRIDPDTRAAVPADPPEFWSRRAFATAHERIRLEVTRLEDGRPEPADDAPAAPPDAWFLADGSLFVAFPGDDGLAYADRGELDLVVDRRPGDAQWRVRAVGLSYGNHTLPYLYDPVVDGTIRLDGDADELRIAFDLEGRVHGWERFPLRGRFVVDLAAAELGRPKPIGNELAAAWEALAARVSAGEGD